MITIDLETYSPAPIADTGAYRYAQDPEFQILLCSYAMDDEPVELVDCSTGDPLIGRIKQLLFDPTVKKRAWNAAFEWWCLSEYFRLTQQQREDWLEQWEDSMVHALYCGLPASLKEAGKALRLGEDQAKMREGAALIRYFCVPCKPTKANGGRTRNLPLHAPEKWELFCKYNRRDVETERTIDRMLEPFRVPESIWEQWRDDLRMNSRGIAIDRQLADGALFCQRVYTDKLVSRAREITGLGNPNSTAQLTAWLEQQGCSLPNLQKATVAQALTDSTLPANAREMLQLRQGLGKTSTTKYEVVEAAAGPDDRIRGCLQFYGANRTGRWAGRLLQVQNLPRTYLRGQPEVRELIKRKDEAALEMLYGDVADVLSQMIRTVLIPAPGKVFIDADFSAIEARLLAWEAGEDWVLDVFRTTGKIYEATASKMFGVPVDTIVKGHPNYSYRQRGKVATLALGYNGGVGAMRRMDIGGALASLPDAAIQDMVTRWRQQNPRITALWIALDRACKETIRTGLPHPVNGGAGRLAIIRMEASSTCPLSFLTIQLPSERKLYYAAPRIDKTDGRIYYREQTVTGWAESETYGGKLAENLTQAIGRDCLEYALQQLKVAGYRVVFHIHDEVVIEADAARADEQLADIRRIMSQPAPWATGLPLNAEGWVGEFFTKD